ncbi:MAG: glycosyltransferase family 4 protein [Rhodospirillales bacterium]|nr:glycosyltransferase family 4 protein [Acetobacter sp.]
MNIAITSLYLPSGSKIGVGYQVHYLANALVRRGHAVTVFSQTGGSSDSLYETVVAPIRRSGRTFRFAWDLRRYDFSRFDVLNAHGDDWFLWGRRRPRHVHTYHGSCFAEMLHAGTLVAKTRMAALAACEYNSLLLADTTVAVSENTRRYFPNIRHVIPCGVDTERFSPGEEKSTKPAVLLVGTMHGRKRGRLLLDVFRKQIRPVLPEAQLWCVCDQPSDETSDEGVCWLGRVDQDTLIDLYRRAWVFCLPSTYEGFGVPYIEAMAAGLPVVATPNVGAREVTRDGRYGILVSDEELGSRLLLLLQDANVRMLWSQRGLKRSKDFSWDTVCQRYEEVYRN